MWWLLHHYWPHNTHPLKQNGLLPLPSTVNKSDSSGCPLITLKKKMCVYQWADTSQRVPELCLGGCSVYTSGGKSTIVNNDSFLLECNKRFLFVFILASRKFTSKAQENQGGFFHVLYNDNGVHSIWDPAQWGKIQCLLSDCSGHFSSLVHLPGISQKEEGGGSIWMCVMLYLQDFSQ